jgi:hypothetical protein
MAETVDFTAEPGSDASAQLQRGTARDRARAFFRQAAERMEDARTLALTEVPNRLGRLAETTKANIASAIAVEKAAISDRIAVARGQAYAAAATARARVNAGYDNAIAAMEAETTTAIDALTAEHDTSLSQVDEAETDGLDTINTLYADSRKAHEEAGVTVGNEAIARGEQYVAAYDKCKIHRKDSFWAGHLTDRRAEAQQNAARETAKGYQKSLEKAGKKQAREMVRGRKQDRCTLIAAARQARHTLDDNHAGLLTALGSGLEQARQNATSSRDAMLAAVDSGLRDNLQKLDEQEQTQRQAANDTGYLQQVAIEQIAHSAAASLQSAVAAALTSLAEALGQVRSAFAETRAPDNRTLDRMLSQAFGAIRTGLDQLGSQVDGGLAQGEQRLLSTGLQALSALSDVTSSNDQQATSLSDNFSGSMALLGANAESTFAQQSDLYVQQTQTATDGGIAGFQQVVTGFATKVTSITTDVGTSLNNSLQELTKSLQNSKASMDDQARGIPKQAREAASHEAPAWKTVLKWVLIIAIIVVVAVVAGPAVIGVVGGAAAALGASAGAAAFIGAVVGGAIVGAATSAAIQVLNNWETNQSLGKGVLRAAAIGAITGAIGGAAGFAVGKAVENAGRLVQFGANLATDAVLEVGTEIVQGDLSWENFGQAMLFSLFTAGLGEIGAVRRVQARVQHGAAGVVPGRRAAAYAESIRPRTEAETGSRLPPHEAEAAPTTPRPETEAGAPAAPRPDTEGGAPTAARPEEGGPGPRPAEEGGPATLEGGRQRSETELDAAATNSQAGPRSDLDPNAPASRLSDAELANTTTNRTNVGGEEHSVGFRRTRNGVECEVCSVACGNIKGKITDMVDSLPLPPAHAELRKGLLEVRQKVAEVEAGIENASMSHQDVIRNSAEIAAKLRELSSQHPDLGKALENPRVFAEALEPAGTAGGTDRVRTDDLGVETGKRQTIDVNNFKGLDIEDGTPLLYALRDKATGAVVKVGQTTMGRRAETRFGRYRRAGSELGLHLELEVTPITNLRGQSIETPEIKLRARLEGAGHILPWDYTPRGPLGGRLGRPTGTPGTPFESPKGGSPLRKQGWRWVQEGPQKGYYLPPQQPSETPAANIPTPPGEIIAGE